MSKMQIYKSKFGWLNVRKLKKLYKLGAHTVIL